MAPEDKSVPRVTLVGKRGEVTTYPPGTSAEQIASGMVKGIIGGRVIGGQYHRPEHTMLSTKAQRKLSDDVAAAKAPTE